MTGAPAAQTTNTTSMTSADIMPRDDIDDVMEVLFGGHRGLMLNC